MTTPTAATLDNLIRNYCNQLGVQPSTATHVASLMHAYSSTMPLTLAEDRLNEDTQAAYRRREAWALDYLKCTSARFYPDLRNVVNEARRKGAYAPNVVSSRYGIDLRSADELVELVDDAVL